MDFKLPKNIKFNTAISNTTTMVDAIKCNLPSDIRHGSCMFDRIYSAGCYANLSYALSKLHPKVEESNLHKDTLKLIRIHQNTAIEVYDQTDNPTVGAVIIPTDKDVVITFHGTNFERKDDHITNFEFKLVKSTYAPGLYHAGFLRLANNIIPEIVNVLQKQYGPLHLNTRPIRIYGHSMGSAIAQLVTQYLQHTYADINLETIVFGSPKVMCPIAAKIYNQKNQDRTMRIENPLDLAIYMPTQFMGYGVVNNVILLPTTYTDMARNHTIEGYLDSISTLRKQFRKQGIYSVSITDYITATARFNPLYPWMPYASTSQPSSSLSEFVYLMGHGLSKGIQKIIHALPFK